MELSDEKESVNPQEASSPPDLDSSAVELTRTEATTESEENRTLQPERVKRKSGISPPAFDTIKSNSTARRKIRKSGRHVCLVEVEEDAATGKVRSWLPPHQYETELRRRAIRRRDVKQAPSSSDTESPGSDASLRNTQNKGAVQTEQKNDDWEHDGGDEQGPLEEFGDVALGMKLTIVGGRVIVESLNALADGRASPAQLTGLIQRGDVLLSVDNVSLVNMPLNQLVEGLKPLSTPLDGTSYQRTLRLRFAAREGLTLLNKREAQLMTKTTMTDSASDMFSLSNFIPRDVPLVDNLSGMPILSNIDELEQKKVDMQETKEPVVATAMQSSANKSEGVVQTESLAGEPQIAVRVADQREWEREKLTSHFFSGDDNLSELLRPSTRMRLDSGQGDYEVVLSRAEMLVYGKRAMEGAKVMCYNMEDIDKGKDIRSFRKWNSQISLRSRASSRRKYLLETKSRAESIKEEECSSSVASTGSSISDDLDGIDGDEMLLGLAAHDEIWRRQVLETLQNAADELVDDGKEEHTGTPQTQDEPTTNLDTAISIELGSLLFGAQMSRIMTKRERPLVLPPSEVTSVLFDLTTNLTTIMPDEISPHGTTHGAARSSLTSFDRTTQPPPDDNVLLASRFVVMEALPAWLKSFRPLPREQRRILWPRARSSISDSQTIGTHSQAYSEDSLTLDSASTGNPSSLSPSKNLQEKIEDMELDVETKAETCYLVTAYMTQVLLPKLQGDSSSEENLAAEKEVVRFVDRYGAYLNLFTCLVCATVVEADKVMVALLRVAKHDPCHQEAMKNLSKTTGLLLYEPSMLSALLKRLRGVRSEEDAEKVRALIGLCVSAFPDLRPWQVRSAFHSDSPEDNSLGNDDSYYHYLGMLMHPLEGHDMARCDARLVQEWCTMSAFPSKVDADAEDSISGDVNDIRKENFLLVASKNSNDHKLYARDVVFLLNLSMQVVEVDLALDLAHEILEEEARLTDQQVIDHVLPHLQTIGRESVSLGSSLSTQEIDIPRLRRVLSLFHVIADKARSSVSPVVVSEELYSLLLSCRVESDAECPSSREMELIDLLADNTDPKFLLPMLALWSQSFPFATYVLAFVRKALLRGVQRGIHSELSGSLLRIKDARHREGLSLKSVEITSQRGDLSERNNIWQRMYAGDAAIEK